MIKVYILDVVELLNEETIKKYTALLPDEGIWKKRITSINDYIFIKDKALSIGAGLLLLFFLKKNGISPADLKQSENGKLYIQQNLFFNISHTDRYVTFSVGEAENGIDIERNDIVDLDVAKHFFTKGEYKHVLEDNTKFVRYWTLKESYLKAIGYGLTLPLNSFEIEFPQNGNTPYIIGESYQFREFHLKEINIAVCSEVCIDKKINYLSLKDISEFIKKSGHSCDS